MDEQPKTPERRDVPAMGGREGGWDLVGSLRRQIDRFFEELDSPRGRMAAPWPGPDFEPLRAWGAFGSSIPRADLVERDDAYELDAELPGYSPDEVEVKVAEGVITLSGRKSAEHEEKGESFHLRERSQGRFRRTFRLPGDIDAERVAAAFKDGVLRITLPKSARARESERKVEIRTG